MFSIWHIRVKHSANYTRYKLIEIRKLQWRMRGKRGDELERRWERERSNKNTAPLIYLCPLLAAIKPMITIQQGNFNFGHEYLKQAVQRRYPLFLNHKSIVFSFNLLFSFDLSIYPQESIFNSYHKLKLVWKTKPFNEQAAFEYPWLLSQLLQHPITSTTQYIACRKPIFHTVTKFSRTQ